MKKTMKPLAKFHDLIPPMQNGRRLGVPSIAIAVALFLTAFDNNSLWQAVIQIAPPLTLDNLRILATFFILVCALFTVALLLFGIKYVFKPALAIILITAAVISYFMNAYGVVIDRAMIQNVFETDVHEAGELLSLGLLWHALLFGILPACLLFRIPIHYESFWREAGKRCLVLCCCLLVLGVTVFTSYMDLSLILRRNRQLRLLVNPSYPVYAMVTYARQAFTTHPDATLKSIARSVVQSPLRSDRERKRVVIFVLGEAARAADFSLNGYARETNPGLRRYDILNFSNTTSCATATADSVPCIFSVMSRANFNNSKAKQSENLLDLLTRAGVRTLWRDNNSGSKGVANRVVTEDMSKLKVDGLYHEGESFDEVLLYNLQETIDQTGEDFFVVLHQKGSHGPLYYKRVPEAYRKFTPECRLDEVQNCSQEQIINSYDNTILYTDHFLTETIELLKDNAKKYDSVMLYMSDHGESLGENGIYLHGTPYFFAPDGQTHIPFIAWLSPEFQQDTDLGLDGLREKTADPYSHDNLFHTVLGLFDIRTDAYQPDLDVFAPWRKSQS